MNKIPENKSRTVRVKAVAVIRTALGGAMALFPNRLWFWLLRLCWSCVTARNPRDSLRFLLQADSDLNHFIDREAIRYDNGVHVKHRLTRYHDFFVDRIHKGDRVLDAGCGNGAVAYDVALRTGASVTAMDLNPQNIAEATRRFADPHVSYLTGDVLTDLPDEHFDVVILSNVLEHLDKRIEFLGSLVSAVTPTRLLIRVPLFEREWRVPLRKELGLEWRSDSTHETEHTLESFHNEIAAAGLSIAHQEVRWGEIWAAIACGT